MVKKILIAFLVIVVILGGIYMYVNYRNRTLSPSGEAQLTNGNLTVSITYSRPSVRGRLIFGTKEQGALQPYGEYWRLGANEATEITFNKDVYINDNSLKAGTYRLYAIPGQNEFELVFNSQLGRWGAFNPNSEYDVLRIKVPVIDNNLVEQYTISMQSIEGGVNVVFEWSDVKFVLPVKSQS